MTFVGSWSQRLHPAWSGLVGVLLYARTASFGLLNYDDPWLIGQNKMLQSFTWEGLRRVLFDLSFEQRFRLGAEYLPMRDLSVMTDFALWGDWFGGHHLTQVLLYGGACAFAAAFALALFADRALAWWVGLAFAAHPLHVESVAWLSERKGVLGALLLFAACWFGVRYLREGNLGRLVIAVVLYASAVLAKGHMLAGAAALTLCALWCIDASRHRRVALTALSVIVGALVFAPVYATGQTLGMVQPYHGGGLPATANLFLEVHGKYLALTALDGPYAIAYPILSGRPSWALKLLGAGALLAFLALVLGAILRPRWRNPATFGLAWWLAFLAPVSHLVFPLQNLLADRYLLVGSWGLLAVLGAGLIRLPQRTRWTLGVLWILASATWTLTQLDHWRSSESLHLNAVTVYPGHVSSWQRLAAGARERGRFDAAWAFTERGLREVPGHWRLLHQQAMILHDQGRTKDAIAAMRRAAKDPAAHKAYANLALLLARDGREEEALQVARQAVRFQPRSAHNQRALGSVALRVRSTTEACQAFTQALRLEPHNADNVYNMGLCELQRGNTRIAQDAFDRAVALDPKLQNPIEALRPRATP